MTHGQRITKDRTKDGCNNACKAGVNRWRMVMEMATPGSSQFVTRQSWWPFLFLLAAVLLTSISLNQTLNMGDKRDKLQGWHSIESVKSYPSIYGKLSEEQKDLIRSVEELSTISKRIHEKSK